MCIGMTGGFGKYILISIWGTDPKGRYIKHDEISKIQAVYYSALYFYLRLFSGWWSGNFGKWI
jgi:hypothetical protein